jgi:hypothetical protein
MFKRIILGSVAFTMLAASATTTPSFAGASFPAVVEKVLMNQTNGPVSKLTPDKKRELISCVNQVLAELPNGRKKFVVAAASYDEMEDRFGTVVMENRAEWKQRIARSCAHIVV